MFRKSIAMLSSGKVLITDRLHSSILAFLLQKPHVYLDQMYGKITKTRQVAFEASSNCKNRTILKFDQAVTVKEAVQKAVNMLEVLKESNN
jgi:exopolysaccharide biosynthesis predicted pyruvyltransferase EpsI